MRAPFLVTVLAACLIAGSTLLAPATAETVVRFPGPQSQDDSRDAFLHDILRLALARTEAAHGPGRLELNPQRLSRNRVINLLLAGEQLNVAVAPADKALDDQFPSVRIPVFRGLLGYRVSLIRAESQDAFAKVENLQDLRQFRAGLLADWGIAKVFQHNDLPVVSASLDNYELLFDMLAAGRFDYFSRGVLEILPEFETHGPRLPNLTVEQALLIRAPLPLFFYVSPNHEALAQRLEDGMEALIADGTYHARWRDTFGGLLKQLNIEARRVIELDNPTLPEGVPVERAELWLDPLEEQAAR
ncbi:hypothetical protein [Roseospirillum parvum]|uniref:Extracellular solute-binding protein, family 3 n=1 Tax=Roseospirillum parvum TaxID=83401 RepID=A0A1G8BXF8_9PROT|nr:hypothetical protein [Roseospirillum parvum]SDH37808.1 hypothetical protein SAMN05421742_106146 [Roseospirillum parvum]